MCNNSRGSVLCVTSRVLLWLSVAGFKQVMLTDDNKHACQSGSPVVSKRLQVSAKSKYEGRLGCQSSGELCLDPGQHSWLCWVLRMDLQLISCMATSRQGHS
jgi:hypothetical protein